MNTELRQKIENDPRFPRGYYARAVLYGTQCLSGVDLAGKARKFGAWYARQRDTVLRIAADYGLKEKRVAHGRRIWEDENA